LNTDADLLKQFLGLELSEKQIELFEKYKSCFLEKNAQINLISKNDEKFLFEKHIFDSLAIHKFFSTIKNVDLLPPPLRGRVGVGGNPHRLLDIGTGGGFPSVPISIAYENVNVFAIDSIRKKITIIEALKADLELKNLFPICDRVEKLVFKNNFKAYDFITTRAVAPMDVILKYALPNLKSGGYFIAYKSKKALEELSEAKATLKIFGAKLHEIIDYQLPLEEVYERNLIIVQKK